MGVSFLEPYIGDTQYGDSTTWLQRSDTPLIAKAETGSVNCNVEGMSAVAESITETFANYKTIKVMDVLISSNVQGSTQKTWHKDCHSSGI